MPTTLVLHFNQALDPALAQNVREYHLVGPLGHTVPITEAVYDATKDTVTLHLGRRINFHHHFKLTVNGAAPTGLANAEGLRLNSKVGGNPGSNYVTMVNRRNLVWPEKALQAAHSAREVREGASCRQSGRQAESSASSRLSRTRCARRGELIGR